MWKRTEATPAFGRGVGGGGICLKQGEHLEEQRKIRHSQHEFVKPKLGQTNLISSSDRVAGTVVGEDAGDVICLYFREALQAVPP